MLLLRDVVAVAVGSRFFAIRGAGRRLSTVTAGLKAVVLVVGRAGGEVNEEADGVLLVLLLMGRYWWNDCWGASLVGGS